MREPTARELDAILCAVAAAEGVLEKLTGYPRDDVADAGGYLRELHSRLNGACITLRGMQREAMGRADIADRRLSACKRPEGYKGAFL